MQIAAGRIIYAPSCGVFYASLLAASITEIVWISHPWLSTKASREHLFYYPKSRLFLAVEAYLTLGLVAETSLTLIWQRARTRIYAPPSRRGRDARVYVR